MARETSQEIAARIRPAFAEFEPYDPAFTPCRVNLSANENTHAMPEAYVAALHEAMVATPLNRYPDPMSNELRDALAKRHGVARESIIVGNGGDEVLFNLLFAFGGPGRKMVSCPPDFSEYALFAQMTETDYVAVWRRADDWSIDENALLDEAHDAALVVLTSPNNPTGNVVSHSLVRRLLDETDALVLVDEAYVEFAPDGTSVVDWVFGHPRLVVLRTLSKAFGLAGLRCGYLVAHPALVDALGAIRQIYSVDVLAQATARAAVDNRTLLEPVIADIVVQRDQLAMGLSGIEGVTVWPSAGNFLLVRMKHASTIRARLRDEYSILVRDFSYAPGLADCLRITVGTAAENDEVIKAVQALMGGE